MKTRTVTSDNRVENQLTATKVFHTLIPYGEEVSLWEENIPIPTGVMIM